MNPVYIYDAIRTPRGRARADGGLADLSPFALLGALYAALEQRTALDPAEVDDVILGCVTQAGDQAANIAKTSLMHAGWPDRVPGITINRYCSSGLDAVNLAALKVMSGQAAVCLAGGVESMSRQPMLSDRASVFADPVLAAQCRMLMMGQGADLVATLYGVSREAADEVALQSQQRAAQARGEGRFRSIVALDNPAKGVRVAEDECIRPQTTLQSLARLEPAFGGAAAQQADALQRAAHPQLEAISHVHTAGNSPAMADGAALVLVADAGFAQRSGRAPRARIVDTATACGDPLEVVSGCVAATAQLLRRQNLDATAVDLFEVHEAFAAITIKCQRDLGIDADRLNVNGGVIALGHPMGATGAMMLGVLLDELERRDLRRGVVAASGAAGLGTAMLIERSAM
jgi:acetyl-CoA C-acetyltransferase